MKKNAKSRIIFLIDLSIIIFSFCAYYIYHNGWGHISYKTYATLAYIIFVWFMISLNSNLYKVNANTKIISNLTSLFSYFSFLTAGVIFFVVIFGNFKSNANFILYPLLFTVVVTSIYRFFYLIIIKHFTENGYYKKHALVVGGDRIAERVIKKIMSSPHLGYKLYGVLADYYHESLPKGIYLGKLERFHEIARSKLIDEVIIALPLRKEKELINIVNKCEFEGIRFRIVPDFYRMVKNRMIVEELDDIPMVALHTEPLNLIGNRLQKRLCDIVLSSIALIILSPLFLVLAIIIKYTDKGPVFFSQMRIGANNKEFKLYKFRSMYMQSKIESDTIWTSSDDSRVTKIGKFMRKTNLDELPQFWNVLKGEMSLVGPRPEREYFVEQFKEKIPDYKIRHLVKSGMTGWAQINGFRGDTSIPERVKYDLQYIQYWSLLFDFKILFLTCFNKKTYVNAY